MFGFRELGRTVAEARARAARVAKTVTGGWDDLLSAYHFHIHPSATMLSAHRTCGLHWQARACFVVPYPHDAFRLTSAQVACLRCRLCTAPP